MKGLLPITQLNALRKHRGKFNTEIVDFLVEFGIGKVTAKKVVTLVAEGKIPHISIRY